MWFGIMFLLMLWGLHQYDIMPLLPCVASTALTVVTFVVKGIYNWMNLHKLSKSIDELDKALSEDDDTEDS